MGKTSRIFILLILVTIFVFVMGGCSVQETNEASQLAYEQISADQAKDIMDAESRYVIIDVRTQEEFDEGHIQGALLIPEYEIKERAGEELMDKEQLILVYCRSGRRSKVASQDLVDLGYTNVKDFGGIMDWKYDIVQ